MKIITVLLVMFIQIWALAQTSNQSHDKIKSGRLQKIDDQELEETLYRLSYNNVDASLFSLPEKKQLAGGGTVKKKIWQFVVPTTLIPTKISDAYLNNTYIINNDMVEVKKSEAILSGGTINDISVLSFLLPLLIIFLVPLIGCGATPSVKKIITKNIFLAEAVAVFSFLAGIIASCLANNLMVSGIIVLILIIVILFSRSTKTEKAIVMSGIIAGSSLAIFSARLSLLGFGVFSSEMLVIWGYLGIYILVGLVAAFIVTKTKNEPEEIILDIEDDND